MRTKTTLVVIGLLLVAGCSGGGGQSLAAENRQGTVADAATEAAPDRDQADDEQAAVRQDRQLIRTAEMRVEVESFGRTRDRLQQVARANGGFVGDESRQLRGADNRTWTEGQLTLRVPADNYSAVIRAINDTGRVVSFEQRTQDVTEQVVDLEARLENLRAERDRLRTLFEQANDTEDVLAVEERLSEVQTEIERTEAKLQSLRRQVALATITVRIEEEPPARRTTEESEWYDTPLASAFTQSIDGVVVAARAGAVFVAYALPYLLAFGVPLVGLAVGVRRIRGGSTAPGEPEETPPDETDDTPPDKRE